MEERDPWKIVFPTELYSNNERIRNLVWEKKSKRHSKIVQVWMIGHTTNLFCTIIDNREPRGSREIIEKQMGKWGNKETFHVSKSLKSFVLQDKSKSFFPFSLSSFHISHFSLSQQRDGGHSVWKCNFLVFMVVKTNRKTGLRDFRCQIKCESRKT